MKEGWEGSRGSLRVGEEASRDPQLAQTVGGSAATVTPSLTHLCLLQRHEKPWSVEHGSQHPGKIPHGPPKGPPAAQHIIHLPWINIHACFSLLPLRVTRCSSLSPLCSNMQHLTIYSLGTCTTCIFLFADARPFPPPTLLPALGHLVLAVTRATCSLHTYLFPCDGPSSPKVQPLALDWPSAHRRLWGILAGCSRRDISCGVQWLVAISSDRQLGEFTVQKQLQPGK